MLDIYGVLNAIIEALADMIRSVLDFLPESPFQSISLPANVAEVAGWVAYFLPIHEAFVFMQALLVVIAVWYVVRWVARFVRYID